MWYHLSPGHRQLPCKEKYESKVRDSRTEKYPDISDMSASMTGGWNAGSIKRLWGFITQLALQEEKSFSDVANIVKNLTTCVILSAPYYSLAFSVFFLRSPVCYHYSTF